jgi:hypothetical protein
MPTVTLPTSAEIKVRFSERQKSDPFEFEVGEYLAYLDYEDAKEFLKPEVTREEWEKIRSPHTREALLKAMLDYMDFAWDKAKGCRGISANRSVQHYIAWTWLAGDHGFSAEVDRLMEETYEFYGKDILVRICEFYGWDHKKWDDGVRVNS